MVYVVKQRVVILSTADFDSAVWTNKQHLAVGLAADHDVIYIESLGLRQPTFSASDLRRVIKKIARTLKSSGRKETKQQQVPPKGITIVTPVVIPLHKYAMVRFFNKKLLDRQISNLGIDLDDTTLWTFSPLTYGMERRFGKVVYHSVDLLHTLPRVPGDTLKTSEIQLLADADYVIASSKGVQNHLEQLGASKILLWENVAHVEAFIAAAGKPRHDRAVFAGNLTPSKIDLGCLQSVIDAGIDLAIAGPIDIDGSGSSRQIAELLDHPRVTYYGNLALPELAVVLATSKVGLIPYEINDYTRGVFPMKVYEYLASGLSIASTALPSFEGQSIKNILIGNPMEFGDLTRSLLSNHDEARISENTVAAQDHSWTSRIDQATQLIKMGGTD